MGVGARALRAGKAVIEVGLLVKPVERQLRALQARVQAVGQKFASIGTFGVSGGGFAGLRNLFIGSLATEALLYPVKLASNIELATAQMSVFTGSTESAQKAMMELMEFSAIAAQSPEEMANQMRLLMTRDISADDSLTFIKSLSVLAAGSRDQFEELVKAFADVRSATRLNGEEMRQFKNTAFNPLSEIAKRTGESMEQLKDRMEAGKVSFDEVAQALQDTVSKGGRFHGMLQKISGTLRGQFNIAVAKAKIALLPLGEHALKPLVEWFKRLNAVLPKITEFFKKHAAVFSNILQGAAATALSATVFTAIGLAAFVASIALGGFAAILSTIGTFLTILLPVIGLLYLAFRGLGITLGEAFGGAKSVIGSTLNALYSFYAQVRRVFVGIANAIAGGDMQLAADIFWKALTAAWAVGADTLRDIWLGVKYGVLDIMLGLKTELQRQWIEFTTWFQVTMTRAISTLKADLYGLFHPLTSQETLNGMAAANRIQAITDLELQRGSDLAAVNRKSASQMAVLAAAKTAERLLGGGDPTKAVNDLNAALKTAEDLWNQQKDAAPGDFGIGGAFARLGLGAAEAAKQAMKQPEAFFDSRLVQQAWGASEEISREQLRVQRLIERNTRRNGGGLPVI